LPMLTIDGVGGGTVSLTADTDTSSGTVQFTTDQRVKLGRGIHGRYLILDIASSEVGFEVNGMTLYPDVMQRGGK
jgi:hypothetical protein